LAHAIAGTALRGEQRVDPRAPPAGRSWCEPRGRIEGDGGLGQTDAVAGQTVSRNEQGTRAGQARDPPVTKLDQRGDHRRDPAGVVDAHVGLATGMR
jgi:hypothetical protein